MSNYMDMIEDCFNADFEMTVWELEFLDTLESKLESGRDLTHKQIQVLTDIWEKVG